MIGINEIKKRISQRGYKYKYVAEKIGVSPVQFSQYLNNKRPLPIIAITKLINFLGL